jgi:hypothetical protein
MPSEKKKELQLAKPEIILNGSLITDEKRITYIEDKKFLIRHQAEGRYKLPRRREVLLPDISWRKLMPNPYYWFMVRIKLLSL